jgi:hypothetical protein
VIKKARDDLNATIQKIGESLKAEAPNENPQAGPSANAKGPDAAEDAEVEILDPESK